MTSVTKTPRFQKDLNEHALYLADHNPSVAIDFVDGVQGTLDLLATQPRMGATRQFANGSVTLRVQPVAGFKNYLIYYQPLNSGILGIRLLHAAMDSEIQFE